MWTNVVVLSEQLVDEDLCLLEPFGVEHFVAQGAVEALVVSVLPGCAKYQGSWTPDHGLV